MGNDLFNFAVEQGLPGWAVLLLGGGAITAIITVAGTIVVAWFNATAAARLDNAKALREHHRANVGPVRDYVRQTGEIIGRGRIELSRADAVRTFLERGYELLRTLDESGKKLGAIHADGDEVNRALHLYFKCGRLLGLALATTDSQEPEPYERIDPYFDLVMAVAGATMDATDAYVFPTWRQQRVAKKRLDACATRFANLKKKTPRAEGHPELA